MLSKASHGYKYGALSTSEEESEKNSDTSSNRGTYKNILIFGLPMAGIFILSWLLITFSSISGEISGRGSFKGKGPVKPTSSDSTCASCPSIITEADCRNTSYPVLGGADFVQFYKDTPDNSDGFAKTGSSAYTSTYGPYTFYFISQENADLFSTNPAKYAPQFGGFCSWGMSGEYCPKYAWNPNCLGPSGNWSAGFKFEDKSYFFLKALPRSYFQANSSYYAEYGAKRWKGWFGDAIVYNTQCYLE